MKELVNKFIELERKVSQEKGDFALFALFLREDALDKWDLIVAAPWIESDRKKALPYIANQIQKTLKPEELSLLSRIVLIDHDNPALESINRALHIEHDGANVQDTNFFGLQIKHAYIITSQRLNVTTEVSVT
jgi:hypothetical protein